MKYLVTGGAGFIGSHLVHRLLKDGHTVHVLDNLSTGFREYLPVSGDDVFEEERFKFYYLDISDWDALEDQATTWMCIQQMGLTDSGDYDGIFHVAGFARIQPSLENPTACNDTNVNGTLNILKLMKLLKIKNIVYSASSSSYGLKNKLPNTEDQSPDCLTPYAYSKYAAEIMCKAWGSSYGTNNVAVKYFNVYGERSPESGDYAPVIGLFFRQALQDKIDLTVVGDGEQKRDFTFVDDVVEANLAAMNKLHNEPEKVTGLTYNVGCGKNYTINEIADMVLKTLQNEGFAKDLKIAHISPRIGESRETLASVKLAKEKLNWEPKVSVKAGIERLKQYYIDKFN